MTSKNYQDELVSLSSKVNEFSFKAPPTEKTIEELGNIPKLSNMSYTNIKSLLIEYGVYILCPIIIFVVLFFMKPSFVNSTSTNEEGEEIRVLNYRKTLLYSICISLPLLVVYYVYLKKKITKVT